MPEPFAHDAVVELAPGSDPAALGAAITIALCGSLDHEPPCPLAPHHSRTEAIGDRVRLRVLFVAEPAREGEVRSLIRSALDRGSVRTPHGGADWELIESASSPVADRELDHARRLESSA